jgi:hypothetical protein
MPIDIKEEYQVYRGNVAGAPSGSQTEEELQRIQFCRERFIYQSNAKSVVDNKFLLAKNLYEIFEQHLQQGEIWNAPYRFPELFGVIQRKASELIYNLPEVKVRATRQSDADFAIALQGALDHTERMTNSLREKVRVIYDSLMYGTGILYEGYAIQQKEITPIKDEDDDSEIQDLFLDQAKKEMTTFYNGNVSERVDPRDFFIDDQASIFYDETGIQGARDCFRRRYYPYSTFMERFKGFKNIDKVVPVSWGTDFFGRGKQPYPKEGEEQKMVARYVVIYEYWNTELDMVEIIANNQEIYFGAIPFKHKRLPFVVYYNYRRDDSCWGTSETEVVAPFIYAKEEIVNLQILDAKLSLQPALAVSGDVTFNPEENELQPGAIFTLRGLNGGKVADAVMPLRFGGVAEDSMNVLQKIEDTQIAITGDDTKALYENPDQLATQTMAKQQTAQKRNRSNVMQNTIESERSRAQLRLSNIVQFYAHPYQTVSGDVQFRRLKIEGYHVKQDNDEAKPMFTQRYGLISYFTLNPASIGNGEGIEIEIVDAVMQDNIKQEEIKDMMTLLGNLTQLLPLDQSLGQSINVVGLIKQIAKKMNVDYDEIFPMPISKEGEDEIDLELQLIMMGEVPPIDPNVDPAVALNRYIKFQQTEVYEKATDKSKAALQQLIQLTLSNAKTYIENRLTIIRQFNQQSTGQQGNVAGAGQPPQQGGGAGTPQVSPGPVPAGGQTDLDAASTAQQAPRGVANRLGYGANQSPSTAT